jgi:hypothetical protein
MRARMTKCAFIAFEKNLIIISGRGLRQWLLQGENAVKLSYRLGSSCRG